MIFIKLMAKRVIKKKKKPKKKETLPPGKKKCKNCHQIIPIHKKECSECGHVHEMKKTKTDIMKNLKKVTPSIIKSIIENDDFNQFRGWQDGRVYEFTILESFNHDQFLSRNWKGFKKTNHKEFQQAVFKYPITCLSSSKHHLLLVESLVKIPQSLTQNEAVTIKTYGLEKFNCVGTNYRGNSLLRFISSDHKYLDTIYIERHIEKIKSFANIVAMLTGVGNLMILSLPIITLRRKQECFLFRVTQTIEIREEHKITAFQWLKSTGTNSQISIVVGTIRGDIGIYRVEKSSYWLERFIPHAHFDMITCLSECPLSHQSNVIFASGCYDGSISIWNPKEKHKIYSINSLNRKIWNLVWDPGAKFLLIVKDETTECCLLACFYSINKIEATVHMANCLQMRTIKNSKSKYLIHHDSCSKSIPILDPVKGKIKYLQLQELRGKSLKKKKVKEENIQRCINLLIEDNVLKVEEEPEEEREDQMSDEKLFPLYSDITSIQREAEQLTYLSTYEGMLIKHRK